MTGSAGSVANAWRIFSTNSNLVRFESWRPCSSLTIWEISSKLQMTKKNCYGSPSDLFGVSVFHLTFSSYQYISSLHVCSTDLRLIISKTSAGILITCSRYRLFFFFPSVSWIWPINFVWINFVTRRTKLRELRARRAKTSAKDADCLCRSKWRLNVFPEKHLASISIAALST